MRDGWGEPSGEPRPDYRDAVEPDVPIEHEGKPARGERGRRYDAMMADPILLLTTLLDELQERLYGEGAGDDED